MDYLVHEQVSIAVENTTVQGELMIPANTHGIIIFSHGSGSSRFSKRYQSIAAHFHAMNFGTLVLELLTEEEEVHYQNKFDTSLLTKRLITITEWLQTHREAKSYQFGYFGASTGAALALRAASLLPQIKAIVSLAGRPDLAISHLSQVKAPTLLIVGSLDFTVRELNKIAYEHLTCEKKLVMIEGASHLFKEHGMMEKVFEDASSWFKKYLTLPRYAFTHPVAWRHKGL